jgi:glyoxylase-like metal-dependent hydrolase (beta-lactamase superfamily II)
MQRGPADARGRLCQRSSAHRLEAVRGHIRALDCDTIIPGHGPVTDKRGVEAVRNDLTYIRDQARQR